MTRSQRPLGAGLLVAAAIVVALYELSVVGSEPAMPVALILAILGGSSLGRSRRKPRPDLSGPTTP
jgi:hypothetical protein